MQSCFNAVGERFPFVQNFFFVSSHQEKIQFVLEKRMVLWKIFGSRCQTGLGQSGPGGQGRNGGQGRDVGPGWGLGLAGEGGRGGRERDVFSYIKTCSLGCEP